MTPLQRTYAIAREATDAQQQIIQELRAEIARLQSGGCARNQSTTQFCAEAAQLQEQMRHMVRLDDPVVKWLAECVEAASTLNVSESDAENCRRAFAAYQARVKEVVK